jgi:hypothetical protein
VAGADGLSQLNQTVGTFPESPFTPLPTSLGIFVGVHWSDGPVVCEHGKCHGYLEVRSRRCPPRWVSSWGCTGVMGPSCASTASVTATWRFVHAAAHPAVEFKITWSLNSAPIWFSTGLITQFTAIKRSTGGGRTLRRYTTA